jgi:hypothetical protein
MGLSPMRRRPRTAVTLALLLPLGARKIPERHERGHDSTCVYTKKSAASAWFCGRHHVLLAGQVGEERPTRQQRMP